MSRSISSEKRHREIIALLKIVNGRRSVLDLVSNGMLYYKVAELLSFAIDENLLRYIENDELILTEKGKTYLQDLPERKDRSLERWVEPLDSQKITALAAGEVYIPSRDVLSQLQDAEQKTLWETT